MVNTKHRSNETEWMDDFDVSGEELESTLNQIALINQWLGGNQITTDGIKQLLNNQPRTSPIRIIDLGCGNGDMLRTLADYGKKNKIEFKLHGIDANPATIDFAKRSSLDYPEIEFTRMNFFSKGFNELNYDIAIATLVLHHFNTDEIEKLLKSMSKATLGIVINDLHRNRLSYYLFKMISIFVKSKKAKQDGLISILRGFKRNELERLSEQLHFNSFIQWKWAFRYQWIIKS